MNLFKIELMCFTLSIIHILGTWYYFCNEKTQIIFFYKEQGKCFTYRFVPNVDIFKK